MGFRKIENDRSIRVHTAVFVAYSTDHTKTLENDDLIKCDACLGQIFLVYETDFLLELDHGLAQIKRVILEQLFVLGIHTYIHTYIKLYLNTLASSALLFFMRGVYTQIIYTNKVRGTYCTRLTNGL